MKRQTRDRITIAAAWLAVILLGLIAFQPTHATYDAILERNGNAYVIDHDLTLDDCLQLLARDTACERGQ